MFYTSRDSKVQTLVRLRGGFITQGFRLLVLLLEVNWELWFPLLELPPSLYWASASLTCVFLSFFAPVEPDRVLIILLLAERTERIKEPPRPSAALPFLSLPFAFPSCPKAPKLSSHNSSREAGKHTIQQKSGQAAVPTCVQRQTARSSALRRGAFPGKKLIQSARAMFLRPSFSTQRNFCPVRGGDPVGSMAAAFSRVSVTAGDIRGELSYLTDPLCSCTHAGSPTGSPTGSF